MYSKSTVRDLVWNVLMYCKKDNKDTNEIISNLCETMNVLLGLNGIDRLHRVNKKSKSHSRATMAKLSNYADK